MAARKPPLRIRPGTRAKLERLRRPDEGDDALVLRLIDLAETELRRRGRVVGRELGPEPGNIPVQPGTFGPPRGGAETRP